MAEVNYSPLDLNKLMDAVRQESVRLNLRSFSVEGESAFTLALALSAAVKKVFYEKSGTTFSSEPKLEKKFVTQFVHRMRVDAMEKFNATTVFSIIEFAASESGLEKQQFLITMVVYLEQKFLPEFLRLLQYPYIDSDEESEVKDGCGTLSNLIAGQYKKEVSVLGYKDITMSPFESYINTIADGVGIPNGATEKFELSFEVEETKRLVVEVVTLAMLPKMECLQIDMISTQQNSTVISGLKPLGIAKMEELFYNLSFGDLFIHETDPRLQGYEKGQVSSLGAVAVDTGRFTGRSPKDKYIVMDDLSKGTVWWADGKASGSDNKPISKEVWAHLKDLSVKQLNEKKLYVMDGFCGANHDTRLGVRLVTEVAWMAHFFKNMFIQPTAEELNNFKPDWTILNACKTACSDFAKVGLRSDVFVAFNITERMTVIGGTWYGGEIKKGIFSIMNYFLPLKGIGAFHCSANMGQHKDTALFFGLSGTGKTTLSTDPKRALIGDDEHGWDNEGVFNFEGGCYAKCIGLTAQREPEVYAAIRRDALLENVDIDDKGHIDFASMKKTENTRVSYPIGHIENIVKPVSKGGHPSKIIFLACDAYGVLPPVSKLTREQAMYHYLSGYTAKVAGTELGVKEPQATFSACFGKAFLLVHPTMYAEILAKKMQEHNSSAYLINTGWVAGPYGVGHRIPLKDNRLAVDAILDGSIDNGGFDILPVFNLQVPKHVNGVDDNVLNPGNLWADKSAYDASLRKLGGMFVDNFKLFADTPNGRNLINAGPHV